MNRYSILRWLAYGLELFILFILQETPGLSISILGEKAFLLLPAALSIALFETNLPAMSFGIVAGVLADFGMGHGPDSMPFCWLFCAFFSASWPPTLSAPIFSPAFSPVFWDALPFSFCNGLCFA